MANEEMNFNNFGEFVDFCKTANTDDWSKDEIARFNKRVNSLIVDDDDFRNNYGKLNNNLKKLGVRFSITEKRKKLSLMKSRDKYRKNKAKYRILSIQSKTR